MPETAARLRHHRTSPTKVRQVLRLIVGKDVADAREILRFCERGPAETVMKLLDSAIANAEHNDNVPEEELFVTRAFADEGPTMKRWRPRARGRGTRIRKRTSHITIVVARYEDDALEQRRRARGGRHPGAARQPSPPGRRQPAEGRARGRPRRGARPRSRSRSRSRRRARRRGRDRRGRRPRPTVDEVETDERRDRGHGRTAETEDAPPRPSDAPTDDDAAEDETAEKPEGSK